MDRKKRIMLEIISSTFCIDPRKMDGFTPSIFKNPDIQIPTVEEEKMLDDAGISIGIDKPLIPILLDMNKAGIKTTGSCQGHRADETGWIDFDNRLRVGDAKNILHKYGINNVSVKPYGPKGVRMEFPPRFKDSDFSEFDKYVGIAGDNGEHPQWLFLKDKYGITRQDVIDFADADQLQREKKEAKEHGLPFTQKTFSRLSNMKRLIKLDKQGKGPTISKAIERIERRHTQRRPMKKKNRQEW